MSNLFELAAKISLDSGAFESGLSKVKSGFSTIAKVGVAALTACSTAVVAFGTDAVKTGMEFDKSMSQVAATMGLTEEQIKATDGEFSKLRETAIHYGETTAYTATQCADALNYMALAGYDVETSISMLPNVLSLAAAGNIDLAYASDMITDSQTALGLTLEETNVLVDQLAKTASKSNTSVEQLGEAILTVGGTAQFMAGGTDELNTVLGVLADNGIKGSEAGTHLRNMILKLSSPTDDGAKALAQLGVAIYDDEGKMRSFADIFQDMSVAMEDFTDEQKIQMFTDIFNARDVASATALLGTSKERWEELNQAILNCEGSAEQMKETQLDNLAGDITIFKSALDGAKIALSDALTPTLREFVKFGTEGIGKLTTAFSKDGFSGVVDALGGVLEEALSKLIEKLPAVVEIGATILTSVSTGIVKNLPIVISAFTSLIPSVIETIGTLLPTLVESGSQVVTELLNGITKAMPSFIEKAPEMISDFLFSLVLAIPKISDAAIEMINGLANGITHNLPKLIEQALPMLLAISSGLRDNIGLIVDAGLNLLIELAQVLVDSLPILIEYVPTIVDNIANIINDNMPKLIEAGIQILITLGIGIIKAIPDLLKNAKTIVKTIIDVITATNWVNLGKQIIQAFADSIAGMSGTAGKSMIEVVKTIISKVQNLPETLKNIGINLIKGLWNGILGMKDFILENLGSIVTSIISTIKDLFGVHSPSTVLSEIGGYLIEGLWEGIKDKVDWIKTKLEGFKDAVIGKLKDVFGIASPSKLFKEQIGKNLALGIGVGFEENMKDVEKRMTSAIPTEFDIKESVTGEAESETDSMLSEIYGLLADGLRVNVGNTRDLRRSLNA